MRINNNVMAFNAYRNLSMSNSSMGKSLEKLSSGLRINRAADDAAGLVISQDLRAQISGQRVAVRNAQDAISLSQTAEGALDEINTMLQRMRDLALQSANGTNSSTARIALDAEFTQLRNEINRIGDTTRFGTLNLFTQNAVGSSNFQTGVSFQVGAAAGDQISFQIVDFSANAAITGLNTQSVALATGATAAVGMIDNAIQVISAQRGALGAITNRFESTINSINVAIENLTASESRIRDVDMAMEMTNFSRLQILQQSGTSMLGQANQVPQSVLSLLGR
jgi:flagellin